jgi:hypothetical protein
MAAKLECRAGLTINVGWELTLFRMNGKLEKLMSEIADKKNENLYLHSF